MGLSRYSDSAGETFVGKLTDDEFETMKKHTSYGMETIAIQEEKLGDSSFLHFAREIAATHTVNC